jgi:hypothetical protein
MHAWPAQRSLLTPAAQITSLSRTGGDDLMLMASDGLWDVMTNQVRPGRVLASWYSLVDTGCVLLASRSSLCTLHPAAGTPHAMPLCTSTSMHPAPHQRPRQHRQPRFSPPAPPPHTQEAATLALRCLKRAQERGASRRASARIAANVLARAAIDRGSRDNITVLIVDLAAFDGEEEAVPSGASGEEAPASGATCSESAEANCAGDNSA